MPQRRTFKYQKSVIPKTEVSLYDHPASNSISDERNFRPKTLEDFIGQGDLKKTLRLMRDSPHQHSAVLEYVVFYGGTGLGEATLTAIITSEQAARFHGLASRNDVRQRTLPRIRGQERIGARVGRRPVLAGIRL